MQRGIRRHDRERHSFSVASQDYPNLEHIIVDGILRPDTPIIFRHAERIDTLISEPDHGIYDALNKGISLATETYRVPPFG